MNIFWIPPPREIIADYSFRLFWRWKIRHGQRGRPRVPIDVRQLIRTMSRENALWGAPRIHGELLKLGIDVGETSVGKYMVEELSRKALLPRLLRDWLR